MGGSVCWTLPGLWVDEVTPPELLQMPQEVTSVRHRFAADEGRHSWHMGVCRVPCWGPCMRDPTTSGSMLGAPEFWKLKCQ